MNNKVIIIRFHYPVDDKRFEWRFGFFKTIVWPRILAQTNKEFDVAIRCNPAHEELFKSLPGGKTIITFQTKNDTPRYKVNGRKRYFHDFVPWSDVIGLPMYDIQIGLDSDDLISPNYVAKIQAVCKGNESLHVFFQPQLFRLKTLRIESMAEYSRERGSAFRALYQPDKSDYRFIDSVSHMILWTLAKKSVGYVDGECFAVAHDLNESTGK
ncbi:MAG: glycosyltransferase [Candidatus Moraniibacteriota bacterium]